MPGELSREPFTPIMRLSEDDRVKVNLLVGAHEEGHPVNIRGTRCHFEPLDYDSGWRNSQMAAIRGAPASATRAACRRPAAAAGRAHDGHGPGNHHDILLRNDAGGNFNRIGEYLYRGQSSFSLDGGLWGIVNVTQNISSGIFSGGSQPAQPSCSVDATTGQTVCLE